MITHAVANGIYAAVRLTTLIAQQNITWQVKMDFILLLMWRGLNNDRNNLNKEAAQRP